MPPRNEPRIHFKTLTKKLLAFTVYRKVVKTINNVGRTKRANGSFEKAGGHAFKQKLIESFRWHVKLAVESSQLITIKMRPNFFLARILKVVFAFFLYISLYYLMGFINFKIWSRKFGI